jgi:hypothetical protein
MKSVERLKAELDLIERSLTLQEKAVARLGAGQPLPEGFPRWAPRGTARDGCERQAGRSPSTHLCRRRSAVHPPAAAAHLQGE